MKTIFIFIILIYFLMTTFANCMIKTTTSEGQFIERSTNVKGDFEIKFQLTQNNLGPRIPSLEDKLWLQIYAPTNIPTNISDITVGIYLIGPDGNGKHYMLKFDKVLPLIDYKLDIEDQSGEWHIDVNFSYKKDESIETTKSVRILDFFVAKEETCYKFINLLIQADEFRENARIKYSAQGCFEIIDKELAKINIPKDYYLILPLEFEFFLDESISLDANFYDSSFTVDASTFFKLFDIKAIADDLFDAEFYSEKTQLNVATQDYEVSPPIKQGTIQPDLIKKTVSLTQGIYIIPIYLFITSDNIHILDNCDTTYKKVFIQNLKGEITLKDSKKNIFRVSGLYPLDTYLWDLNMLFTRDSRVKIIFSSPSGKKISNAILNINDIKIPTLNHNFQEVAFKKVKIENDAKLALSIEMASFYNFWDAVIFGLAPFVLLFLVIIIRIIQRKGITLLQFMAIPFFDVVSYGFNVYSYSPPLSPINFPTILILITLLFGVIAVCQTKRKPQKCNINRFRIGSLFRMDYKEVIEGTKKIIRFIKENGYFPSPADGKRKREGKGPALMPLYYNIKLLDRYLRDKKYSVTLHTQSTGAIVDRKNNWFIGFGINKNDNIQVWLKDFEELPSTEKARWAADYIKEENEPSFNFIRAELMCSPADLPKEKILMALRNEVNNCFSSKMRFFLFLDVGNTIQDIRDIFRPIMGNMQEFLNSMTALNKLFTESINIKSIKNSINSKKDTKSLGSLKILELFLKRNSFGNVEEIMAPFYILDDFRIVLTHKSNAQKFNSCLERLNLKEEKDLSKVYFAELDALIFSLKKLKQAVI